MPSWKKVIISGSDAALNSLTVTNGITGSLLGTASYTSLATNVAGGANRILFNSSTNTTTTSNNLTWTDSTNLLTLGDATGTAGTISKLALYTSSFGGYGLGISPAQLDYVSDGSHVFYKNGSTPTELVRITNTGDLGINKTVPNAKLDVNGDTIITGSLNVTNGIAGSLQGTASYATQALSASWAPSSGGTTIRTQEEGVTLSNTVTTLNFVGAGVTATGAGATTTITIPGGAGAAFPYTGSAQITGSLGITGSLNVSGVIRGVLPDPTGVGGITSKLLSYSTDPYGLVFRSYSTGQHSIQNQRESTDGETYTLSLQPNGSNVAIGKVTANAKLDVNGNTTITGSLINGSVGNISSGQFSHAEGSGTKALGDYSHAEGLGYLETATSIDIVNVTYIEFPTSIGTLGSAPVSISQTTLIVPEDYSTAFTTLPYTLPYLLLSDGVNSFYVNLGYPLYQPVPVISSVTYNAGSNQSTLTFSQPLLSSYSLVEGNGINAQGGYSHAEGYTTTAAGIGSHTEGFSTSTYGLYSHAEGYSTTATNTGSHAEGYSTIASGMYSHTEGEATIASGQSSHAEGGGTEASNYASHAEGYFTIASGLSSHAEGQGTQASGSYSHAEGAYTTASGNYSHTEGLYTVAQGIGQHVQGQYNLSSSAQSAFIVGNGTSDIARSNLIFASGSIVQVTGSLRVDGSITGSLLGTASYAVSSLNAQTASYVTTAVNASSASNFVVTTTLRLGESLTDYATVNSTIVGDNNLYTQATGSYTSAFVKYAVSKGTNSRAGELIVSWNGTAVTYFDNSTADTGTSTSQITFIPTIVTGNIQINAAATSTAWKIKTLATFI